MWAPGKSQICLHAFSHWRYMKLQNLPPGPLHCLGCTDHKEHENVTGAFCVWSPGAWALCGIAGKDKIIGCRWPAECLVRVEDVLNKKSDPVKAEKEGGGSRSALTALWAQSWVFDPLFCLHFLTCGMSSQQPGRFLTQGLLAEERGSGSLNKFMVLESQFFHLVSGYKQELFQLAKITSGYLDGSWR